MPTRRSLTAVATILTMLLLTAVPAGAATTRTARGTAATTSVPLHVETVNLPIDLGVVAALATTDSDTDGRAPFSSVGLTLLNVGGARFGDLRVNSDGTTTNEGVDVSRDTAAGAVTASAVKLLAQADDNVGSATAAVSTLTTEATVLNALDVSTTVTDVVSDVDDSAASATHTLALAGIDVDLAHVLGSVLSTLPLQDLVDLAGELGVTVPGNIDAASDVVTATEDLLTAVADVAAAATGVEDAANDLLAADAGRLAELESLLAQAEALDPVGDPAGTITALTALLADATIPEDCATLSLDLSLLSIESDVAAVIACLEAEIDEHLATLTDALAALEDAVQAYAAAVTGATDAATTLEADSSTLADIVDEIEELLDGLLAADLFAVGPIEVSQEVRAIGDSLAASSASHTCQVTTVRALDEAPVEIANCDGTSVLGPVVDTITTTLQVVLDTVGGVDAGDGVALELFGTTEDAVTETDDGFVRATSVLEVLALTVPDITITACDVADELVCALGIDLDGTLATLLDEVDGVLTTAQTTASDALASVSDLLTALDSTLSVADQAGAQAVVDNAIATLQAVLDTLDLGELGTGGGTVVHGARVMVTPQLQSEHQVTTATVDDPTDADPAPDPDDPTLPNTGGGAALLAALAIGAGTWLWRGRRREG